jgi:hypothetical protein
MDKSMQEFENKVNLWELPKMVKVWLSMFIIVMGFAYCLAILNVYANTGMTYKGVADRYNGNEAEQIFAPDFKEIAGIAHTHMGAMGMMFFLMALPFLFTKTLPYWLKKVVLVDSFFAVLIANASFWLIRFAGRPWAILMILSGMLLGLASFFMVMTPLYEMWVRKYFIKKIEEVK